MDAPTLSLIAPLHNEAPNLPRLLEACAAALERTGESWEILLIDDGSRDASWSRIQALTEADPSIGGIRFQTNAGKTAALAAGFAAVRGDIVFMMDADLSHQPRHLADLDRALDESDFAVGSRYVRGVSVLNWSILRLNLSIAANSYVRLVTGMPFSDCTSGFRGFRSGLLPLFVSSGIRASGYAFLVEMLYRVWRSGRSVSEVPIVFVERRSGASKISAGVLLESVLTPLRLSASSLLGTGADRRPPSQTPV